MQLEGRVAFITDGASDNAIATARKLATEGALVIINVAEPAHIRTTHAALGDLAATCRVVAYPLGCQADVQRVQSELFSSGTPLDILIHTQDLMIPVSIEACEFDTFKRVLDTNTKTAFFCTQVLGRVMSELGRGQIVYLSSVHDEKPTGSSFLYSASKGAVQMLCREAALDLGRGGVRVNVIEIGPMQGDDERFHSDFSDVYLDYQWKVPSTVLGEPDDVANLVCFLVSDEARFINGSTIRMDGGFVLHYMDHKMKRP